MSKLSWRDPNSPWEGVPSMRRVDVSHGAAAERPHGARRAAGGATLPGNTSYPASTAVIMTTEVMSSGAALR